MAPGFNRKWKIEKKMRIHKMPIGCEQGVCLIWQPNGLYNIHQLRRVSSKRSGGPGPFRGIVEALATQIEVLYTEKYFFLASCTPLICFTNLGLFRLCFFFLISGAAKSHFHFNERFLPISVFRIQTFSNYSTSMMRFLLEKMSLTRSLLTS